MKPVLGAALAALLLSAALPAAQAQADFNVTLAVDDLAAPIPYSGSASLSFNATVSCLAILRSASQSAAPEATLTVTLSDPPAWISSAPATVAFPPDPACLTGGTGYVTRPGAITVTVTADAPAVEELTLNFTATLPAQGDPMAGSDSAVATVEYKATYTLSTDAKFPLTVTAQKTSFNLTVTQSSNARSMVMMEEIRTSAGSIAGLASQAYENRAGQPDTKVFKVTFTAPSGAWNTSTTQFKAYSHFLLLDGRAGAYDPGTAVTWEFVNGGVPAPEGNGNDKKSPMPVAPLLALGLVALAAFARRRA